MILSKKAHPNSACIKGYGITLLVISFLVFFSTSLQASIKDIKLEKSSKNEDIIQKIKEQNLTADQIREEERKWKKLIILAFQLNKMDLVRNLIEINKKAKDEKDNSILGGIYPKFWSTLIYDYLSKYSWQDANEMKVDEFLTRCDKLFNIISKENIVITINPEVLLKTANDKGNLKLFKYFLEKGDKQHAKEKTYWLNGSHIDIGGLGKVTFLHALFYDKRPTEILKEVLKKVNKDPKKGINLLEKSYSSTERGTALIAACDYDAPEQNALLLLDELQILYESKKEEVIEYMNINYNPVYFEHEGSVNRQSALDRALSLYQYSPNPKETKLQLIIKLLSFEKIDIQPNDISLARYYFNDKKFAVYELILALLEGKQNKKNLITTVTDFLKEKNNLAEKKEKLASTLLEREKTIKNLNKQLQDTKKKKDEVETLTKNNQTLQSEINELQKKIESEDKALKLMKEGSDNFEKEKKALQDQIKSLNNTVNDLTSENNRNKQTVDSLRSKLKEANTKRDLGDPESLNKQINELQQYIKTSKEENPKGAFQEMNQELHEQINTLNAKLRLGDPAQLKKEKEALEQTLQSFQKGGNLDQMTTEWQEEKAALEQKLNEANQTITDEKVNLTATQSSLASTKRWVWVLSIISVGMIMVCVYGYKQVKQKVAQTV
ncbi:MAG: hypothetical protein AAF770_01880, partial [Bacteroidota bacterium]